MRKRENCKKMIWQYVKQAICYWYANYGFS